MAWHSGKFSAVSHMLVSVIFSFLFLSKVDQLMVFLHLTWTAVVQVIVALGLLIHAVGPSALVGLAVGRTSAFTDMLKR